MVIAQSSGGDLILIPAGTAASTGATVLLEETGSIVTHIKRWFMTGAEAGALGAVFYFGATIPAGPEDETTPLAAAADWADGKLNVDNFR